MREKIQVNIVCTRPTLSTGAASSNGKRKRAGKWQASGTRSVKHREYNAICRAADLTREP